MRYVSWREDVTPRLQRQHDPTTDPSSHTHLIVLHHTMNQRHYDAGIHEPARHNPSKSPEPAARMQQPALSALGLGVREAELTLPTSVRAAHLMRAHSRRAAARLSHGCCRASAADGL